MVTMKAKQMVSKFDLDVLKQPLTFNIIITIIPVGRVMYLYTALTGVDRWIGHWEDCHFGPPGFLASAAF